MGIIIFLIICYIASNSTKRKKNNAHCKIHVCHDGFEGHERRVSEFYGDDYDQIIKDRESQISFIDKHPENCIKISSEEFQRMYKKHKTN